MRLLIKYGRVVLLSRKRGCGEHSSEMNWLGRRKRPNKPIVRRGLREDLDDEKKGKTNEMSGKTSMVQEGEY